MATRIEQAMRHPLDNERGAALLTAIMVMALLLIIGMAASRTTDMELTVARNEKQIATEFYDAEAGLARAMETTDSWLTDTFLAGDVATAQTQIHAVDPHDPADPADDEALATVRVRPVQDADATAAAANDLPVQAHSSPPPPGSGFGMNKFVVRRYAVTAEKGATRVQAGIWKIFNK